MRYFLVSMFFCSIFQFSFWLQACLLHFCIVLSTCNKTKRCGNESPQSRSYLKIENDLAHDGSEVPGLSDITQDHGTRYQVSVTSRMITVPGTTSQSHHPGSRYQVPGLSHITHDHGTRYQVSVTSPRTTVPGSRSQ